MTPTTPTPTPAFRGWFRRPRGRWQCLAEGVDFDSCWQALLGAIEGKGGGLSLVLEGDRHPGDPPPGATVGTHKRGRSFTLDPARPAGS